VESVGSSTWGVGENFNEFDSRLTFRSPIVCVCATSVSATLGNSSGLAFQQNRIMPNKNGCNALSFIPTLDLMFLHTDFVPQTPAGVD